jgi:hypothetical protein
VKTALQTEAGRRISKPNKIEHLRIKQKKNRLVIHEQQSSDILRDAAGRLVLVRVVDGVQAAVLGRVVLLAVHRVVADGELVVGHAQRHDESHHQAHQGRRHHVPADDEERAGDLPHELHAVPVEDALGVDAGRKGAHSDGCANKPVVTPPRKPAAAWVWNTTTEIRITYFRRLKAHRNRLFLIKIS